MMKLYPLVLIVVQRMDKEDDFPILPCSITATSFLRIAVLYRRRGLSPSRTLLRAEDDDWCPVQRYAVEVNQAMQLFYIKEKFRIMTIQLPYLILNFLLARLRCNQLTFVERPKARTYNIL